MTTTHRWTVKSGSELTASELYGCLQLRAEVFVVEQDCPYQDLDAIDLSPTVYHIFGYVDDDKRVGAYLRIFTEKSVSAQMRIGRVVVRKNYRAIGLGRALMNKALELIDGIQVTRNITSIMLHGQSYLRQWYESFGFRVEGDEFLEDGIPHFVLIKDI